MARVRVKIDGRAIDELTLPGGMVYRYMNARAMTCMALAKTFINSRSGRLAGSLTKSVTPLWRSWQATIGTKGCDYALFVHEGTRGPIRSERAVVLSSGAIVPGRLAVGRSQGQPPRWRVQVRGQRANPFLRDAMRAAFL